MALVIPERPRRLQDPQLAPVNGERGTCALCGQYGDLSRAHIFPQSIGNKSAYSASGFLDTLAADPKFSAPRRFPNGVCFKTICVSCNSVLGSREDKELEALYSAVQRDIRCNSVVLSHPHRYEVRPNLLVRAIFAHLASANDRGPPTRFDDTVRNIFSGKTSLKNSGLNVFYWHYAGTAMTIARDIVVKYFQEPRAHLIHLAKLKPLGFAVTESSSFMGFPAIPIAHHDDATAAISLDLSRGEKTTHWPAHPGDDGMVLASSNSAGFIAFPVWKPAGLKKNRPQGR